MNPPQSASLDRKIYSMSDLRPSGTTRRGCEHLRGRQRAAQMDEDLIKRFKALTGEVGSYQRLINQAALRHMMQEVLDDR